MRLLQAIALYTVLPHLGCCNAQNPTVAPEQAGQQLLAGGAQRQAEGKIEASWEFRDQVQALTSGVRFLRFLVP